MTTTKTTSQTTAEYVTKNWQYFQQSWRLVNAAIKHYQNNPGDLENERVGVNAFNDKTRGKDVSSARVAANPRPNESYGELINRIRKLHGLGADAEEIQLQIGPVVFDGQPADLLAISSIRYICRTGPPLVSRLSTKVMK